ncbi:hypothetical protein ACGFK1_02190 [Mycobacterium sp. NPDC048908]|uniref:hypothetical protein n=1 Tax=Mycobacterium sp. NPDC048908 TaxID=3364292 RepID=UPI00370FC472
MARANRRIAAGVGLVAACLLVTAPCAAVAVADPGARHGSHQRDNTSSKRGAENANPRGSGSDYSDDKINGGANSTREGRPSTRVGSGRASGTSEERPSNDYSPNAGGQSNAPKVTVGDGRSPGIQSRDPGPRWGWRAPAPAAPPPPPPPILTVPLNPPAVRPAPPHPGVVEQLVVSPTAGTADPLWGVAGLLLIPAAGAVLGYRQARGAHSAAELSRRS